MSATVLAASASGASAGTRDAASKAPPSQAVVAKKLAARVTRARTPRARYKAILAVMRTLHVGVVTGKGKARVRGGRPHEVYLYDFEIKTMAGALKRRQTNTAAELAGQLSAAGVKPGGNPLTAEQLARKLKAGTRAALSRKRTRLSLVPLLARELGLRQRRPYELATAPTDKLRFDALQTFLIGADVAVAASRQRGAASQGAPTTIARQGTSGSAAALCDGAEGLKEFMPLGKWLIGFIKQIPGRAINITIDAIHGPLLAFSVQVVGAVGPNGSTTHYGPAGHEPDAGKPLDFRVHVVMLDEIRDVVIKCGPLIGITFPKQGPIPGVTVLWQDASIPGRVGLHAFGTKTYPKGETTDQHGITELHFVPKDEKVPGFGGRYVASNAITATALYQSAFKNVPGSLAQFLTPKHATFGWAVGFHHPRGFKFSGMIRDNHFRQFDYPAGRIDADMHVCGDDPFAPWTGTRTYVSEGTPLTFDVTWAFVPGVPTSPVDNSYGVPYRNLDGQLNLTPPFSATFTAMGYGDEQRAGPFSLPLEEDKDCPDNTPFGSERLAP